MYQVICIGSSSKDIFFPTGEGMVLDTPEDITAQRKLAFELGAKYQVEKIYEVPGGCAANVAQGLARLGIKSACYTKVGNDQTGKWIKKELKKEKVSVKLVEVDRECKSDVSAIVVDKKTKEHIVFFNRESNTKLIVNPKKIKKTEWIFISALNGQWEENADQILVAAQKNKIKIVFNPGQRNIKDNPKKVLEIVKNSEIVILNKDEAIEILLDNFNDLSEEKLNDEIFLIRNIAGFSKGIVALTDGENGSWVFEDNQIFFCKIKVDEVVDSLGAGDAFSSGFLAGYLKTASVEEALRFGMANSTNVILYYGAKEGLLKANKIEEKIKNIEVRK